MNIGCVSIHPIEHIVFDVYDYNYPEAREVAILHVARVGGSDYILKSS